MNHHSWLAIWAHPCSTSSHIPSAYRWSEHLRRLFGVLAKPRFCSHGKEWTSLLFLGRSEVNEVNDYIVILHIYIYLVGGWPTPLENIMHENDLIIFTAVKMLLLLSELVSIQRSDDLHIPWSSLTSLMRGLWWSGHFLLLPRITELPIMTQDQSTCRIFSPLTDPPETAPKLCEL